MCTIMRGNIAVQMRYILSIFAHAYNIIIDCGVVAPLHGRYFVDYLNAAEKQFISMIITTVKLPGSDTYDSQMKMHTTTENTTIILAM